MSEPDATVEMPRYRNVHTGAQVWALRVATLTSSPPYDKYRVYPEAYAYAPFAVAGSVVRAYGAQVGCYYILHQDGSKSFRTASAFNRDYRVDYESRYENKTRLPTKENIQEIIRASDTIHAQGVTLNADNQSIRPSALHRAATCLRRALLGWLWP
jgi:hypothetical protein